ncbi:MAG: TetR/AcrR family transcriptional regulator [Pseudomonadota bacterium]
MHKKNYHHGDLKPALIQAGLDILEEEGLEGLSMRAIAARVGVSHTAPKNHFDGLHGLLSAIAAEGFRRHAAEMQKDVEDAPPGRERLDAACVGYIKFAREHGAMFRLMFSPRFNKKAEEEELATAAASSYGVLRGIAEGLNWQRPGPELSPELEAMRTELMLWVFVHGYASLVNEGQMPADPDGKPLFDVLELMPQFDYGN